MDKQIAKPSAREENERAILAAAERVFAEHGFGGATIAAIAARAGVPKPNVHYYFPTKERLYRAVVERVLTEWLAAAAAFDTSDDPAQALTSYISAKMDLARAMPLGSKIWASEIMRGAPAIQDFLDTTMGAFARAGDQALDRRGQTRADRAARAALHDLGDDAAIRQRRPRDRDARARRIERR
jgi:TetR/AcrR family transcriptional regulator